jgi:Tol biopolymer transport system component
MHEAPKVSSVRPWSLRAAMALLVGLLGAACSDNVPTFTQSGSLQVTVRASGGDLDLDGYEVVLDSKRHFLMPAGPAQDLSRIVAGFEVEPGTYDVSLERVDANCAVAGPASLRVTITAGAATPIAFEVVCSTTGISVTTLTTGPNVPGSYTVQLKSGLYGITERTLTPKDSLLVSRLQPGPYTVTLVVPDYCTVAGTRDVPATVATGTVTTVRFAVACVTVPRPPKIVFVVGSSSDFTTQPSLEMMNVDGSGRATLGAGDSPAWSPDGKKLVVSIPECGWYDYDQCPSSLMFMDPDLGTASKPLSGNGGALPAWSPTGDVIAFVRPGPGFPSFFTMAPDGTRLTTLKLDDALAGRVAWSPDGRRIAFACATPARGMCVANSDGTAATRLTDSTTAYYADPAWSPDGRSIAFTRNPLGTSVAVVDAVPEIVVLKLDDRSITRLTDGAAPAWSPDGTKLVFEGPSGLYTINADGSNRVRLTTGPHHAPAWRP